MANLYLELEEPFEARLISHDIIEKYGKSKDEEIRAWALEAMRNNNSMLEQLVLREELNRLRE